MKHVIIDNPIHTPHGAASIVLPEGTFLLLFGGELSVAMTYGCCSNAPNEQKGEKKGPWWRDRQMISGDPCLVAVRRHSLYTAICVSVSPSGNVEWCVCVSMAVCHWSPPKLHNRQSSEYIQNWPCGVFILHTVIFSHIAVTLKSWQIGIAGGNGLILVWASVYTATGVEMLYSPWRLSIIASRPRVSSLHCALWSLYFMYVFFLNHLAVSSHCGSPAKWLRV